MLGYKYDDIEAMKISLERAEFYVPDSNMEVKQGLGDILDLLNGLLVEGHIS